MNFADGVQETTNATSAATVALLGAVAGGPRTFVAGFTVGATNIPVRVGDALGNFETGLYTLTSSALLTRTAILASSNGGAAVAFPAGTKNVTCVLPAISLLLGLVDPADIGFDIILVAGQSNAVGRGTADAVLDTSDPRIFQWGCTTGQSRYQTIFPATEPLQTTDGLNPGSVGPAMAFAKAYLRGRPNNRMVMLVPCAVGGTALCDPTTTTPWAVGGTLYNNATTQSNAAVAAAIAVYPNSRFVGIYWGQGEQDSGSGTRLVPQATYVTANKAIIAGWRAAITGASNSFFMLAGMAPGYIAAYAEAQAIRNAHIQVASETNRAWYVAGRAGYDDALHYIAQGLRLLGTDAGLAVRNAQQYLATDVIAPTAASASVANSTPTIVGIAMTEAMDASFIPAASAFTVGGHTVSSVSIVGSTINLTVGAFVNGETARTVAYTQPGANNARDVAGNLLANFSALAITNNVIGAATAVSMSGPSGGVSGVASANFTLGVTPLSGTIAGTLVVTPSDGGAGGTFTPTTRSLTTGAPTGTFTYTPASTGAKTISVTNNGGLANPSNITYTATASDVTAPAFSSAQVADAAPSDIVITFNETLGASTPPTSAFAVSGGKTVTGTARSGATVTVTVNTPYANGDVITVTYTAPGADPRVQDASANVTASFGPSSVTNNIAAASAFATWNPADKSTGHTLSSGNKTITGTSASTSNWCSTRSTLGKASGKWYWEVTIGAGANHIVGVGVASDLLTSFPGNTANGVGYYGATAAIFRGGSNVASGTTPTFTAGDIIGVNYDADANTVGFTKNGVQASTTAMYAVPDGTAFAMNATRESGSPAAANTTNFGGSAFAYTPRAGHVGLA
jgi:hypothetical protein